MWWFWIWESEGRRQLRELLPLKMCRGSLPCTSGSSCGWLWQVDWGWGNILPGKSQISVFFSLSCSGMKYIDQTFSWEASVIETPQQSQDFCSLFIVCLQLPKNYDVQNCIQDSKRWKKAFISSSHACVYMGAHTNPPTHHMPANIFQWDVFLKNTTKFTLLICILLLSIDSMSSVLLLGHFVFRSMVCLFEM